MARIELYGVFAVLDGVDWGLGNIRVNLAKVTDKEVQGGVYGSKYIVYAIDDIDAAIAELQKAKQILTKG